MRRWIGSVLGLGTLLAIAFGFVRWPVSPDWASRTIASAGLGVTVSQLDDANFVLLPWPMLRIRKLAMATAPNALQITAPAAEVSIGPVSMLRGAVVISGITLRGPRAEIDVDRLLVKSDEIITGAWPWKGRIDIVGGQTHLVSASRNLDEEVTAIDGALEWRMGADTLRVWMSGKTSDNNVSIDGRVSGRRALRQGGGALATLHLSVPNLDLDFDGSWRQTPEPTFDGDLNANIRSPRLLNEALGFEAGWSQSVGVRGRVKASPSGIAMADAEVKLANQAFEGSLSLSRKGKRPTLSATVDTPSLDFGALFGAFPTLMDADGNWSSAPVLPQPTVAADMDLRISANKARWGVHNLTDVAFAVLQKDALLTIKLLDVGAYGGMVSGEVEIQGGPSPLAQVSATLSNADIGGALAEWGAHGLTAHGKTTLRLAAQGVSPAAVAASAKGDFSFELGAGSIDGLNLEEGLRRSQRRQVELTRDLMVGQTRFLSAKAGASFEAGRLNLLNGRTDGPGAAMAIDGTVDIVGRTWDLNVDATQTGSDGAAAATAPHLVVRVTGAWAAPELSVFSSPN